MSSIGLLIVIAAVFTTAYGQNLDVNNSTRDYFRLAQRELLHSIDTVDNEIISIESRHSDRLDVVDYQQKQSLSEIQQVNRTLVPLQALSLIRKHCIQTYSPLLTTYIDAESQMKLCYSSAAIMAKYLTTYARNNAELAREFATSELSRILASCDYYNQRNQTALELCYIEYVTLASSVVDGYLKKARGQLTNSLFYSSESSKAGVKCTFRVEKDILRSIEQTTKLLSECEESLKSSTAATVASSKILEMGVKQLLSGRERFQNK